MRGVLKEVKTPNQKPYNCRGRNQYPLPSLVETETPPTLFLQ